LDRTSFIIRRLWQIVLVIIGIVVVTFFLIRAVPGDPAVVILGERATPESLASLRAALGLDQPLPVQFAVYVGRIFSGDLGTSISSGTPVIGLIIPRMQVTIFLVLYSVILASIIALPLATIAALRSGGLADQMIRAIFTVTMAMPSFWIGIILILVLSVRLHLFPVSGYGDSFTDHLWHLFLPALTTALYLSSMVIRSLRNSFLDLLNSEHVAFARSQGLTESTVFRRHTLRNGLSPTISVLAITTGWLIGSTVVIETVFSIPGAGRLLIDSVFRRDYPVISGLIILFALMAVTINLVADLMYTYLDPRVNL
jgi:peptide/nickel transport system permease protein